MGLRTVYDGDVTSTRTVTDTTEVPTRTVTITTTSTEFALKKLMARAAIPTAPYLKEARDAIHAEVKKRQASGFVTPNYAATLTSGCRCGPPTPLTTNDICTDDAFVS
jgi:hypothetical protein